MLNKRPESICARIAQLRLETAGSRGKSLFAKQLGISPSTYDYYENDRVPPAEILVKIADLCNVDLRWLLTGQASESSHVSADNPALVRAARLIGQNPQAAQPLLAFLDLLEQSMKFPAKPAVEPIASEQSHVESASSLISVQPPQQSQQAEPQQFQQQPEQQSLIPVLGRSAAGIAQFWKEGQESSGVTTLDKIISRHVDSQRHSVSNAKGQSDLESKDVQIISLSKPGSDNVAEFVSSAWIKNKHPDAFAVRIDGLSMAPEINHGDIVVLSPSQPAVDGKAAVVQFKNQIGVTCKLFRRQGSVVHLVPINEQFPPQSFPADEVVWALKIVAKISLS